MAVEFDLHLLGEARVVFLEDLEHFGAAEVIGHVLALGKHLPELGAGQHEPVFLLVRAGPHGGHPVALEAVERVIDLQGLRARRPRHFFRPDGPMPEQVEMRLAIPPELGREAEVLAELRERVQAVEAEHEAERRRTGRRVLGRRAVLQQSWRGYPSSVEPRRTLRPQVASRSKWHRIEALLRNRAFIEDYIRARDAWRQGNMVAFPPGTYWLRRFANVIVAET